MKGSIHTVVGGAVIALLAGFVGTASAQLNETMVVPFSDPSRPGKIEAHLLAGTITVRGENRRDVEVVIRGGESRRPGNERPAPPAGLRRLTQTPGLEITEERNELKIESGSMRNGGANLELRVPLRTNLELGGVNGGTITVENVEGEIEIVHVNGSIVLTNVAGSVVAGTQNGSLTATLSRVMADKAMAFTSFNGKVDVTLPANIRANFKMRSDNGDILTDFDVQLRQGGDKPSTTRRGPGTHIEVNRAIYGSVNGGGPEIELRSFNGTIYLRKGQ
ncbi:MAG TPA: hypothetical protein VGQ37_16850 [Vicinamibacterales bacterium]|jgi:hypothetical protein|nr:hypothetical protein [Vicinamibacterales bacterium]